MTKRLLLMVALAVVFAFFGCMSEPPLSSNAPEQLAPEGPAKFFPPGLSEADFIDDSNTPNRLALGTLPPVWETNIGTPMGQYDDDSRNVSLPFAFDFYGVQYTDAWLNSNGHITFDGQNRSYWSISPLDNQDGDCDYDWSPGYYCGYSWRIIAALYTDLNPYSGGDVYYTTTGVVGDQRFVVTWLDIPEYPYYGANSFQVQLIEATNQIQIGYAGLTVSGYHYSWPMTIGIGAGDGTGLLVAAGADILAYDGTNICFTPDGNGGYIAEAGVCQTNEPPVADAGEDQVVECTGDSQASVTLSGAGSYDPDEDELSYDWFEDGVLIASGIGPTLDFGLGTHTLTLIVDDGNDAADADEVVIEIVDTTAPVIDFTLETEELWPPNHSMILVAAGVGASDICCDFDLVIDIACNEDPNGSGDGDTDPDWEVMDNGDGTFDIYLRAERSGNGDGREYTITVSATDCAENAASEIGMVTVPHSKGKKK